MFRHCTIAFGFIQVHSLCKMAPTCLWSTCCYTIQHSCTESIKLLAIPLSTNNPVCSRCGAIMVYRPVHVLMECSFLNVYHQSLWDDIVDLLDVSFSVDLFQKDDICALSIMLGGFWDMYPDIEKGIYSSFITNNVKHIKRMIDAYGQRLIFG